MIKRLGQNTVIKLFRLFDSEGEGFIPVTRFREILKEVDEDFTDSELDDIIAEVIHLCYLFLLNHLLFHLIHMVNYLT